MKPPLRYAKTVDGGNVAYAFAGDGYPLIDITGGPPRNIAVEWETPGFAEHYRALAQRFRFIRMEPRGHPRSSTFPRDRKYADWILEDIDAVAGALHLERFALLGGGVYVTHAAEFAAIWPGRVSHLILKTPFKPPDGREGFKVLGQLGIAATPEARSHALARMLVPGGDAAHQAAIAALLRIDGIWDPEMLELCAARNREFDPIPFLSRIRAATLVVAEVETFVPLAREIATAIDGAQLLLDLDAPRDVAYSLDLRYHEGVAEQYANFVYGADQRTAARPAAAQPAILARLTPREREILVLVAAGHSNGEIGQALVLSRHTIERHMANIYGKLGVHNRTQAAALHLGSRGEGSASTA